MRRQRRLKIPLVWMFLLILGFLLVLHIRPVLQAIYPIQFSDKILANANQHDLDPFLVAALVRVESNYDPNAVSPKGAVGLLQLMPDTGQWAAMRSGLGEIVIEELFRPEVNLYLGTWYFRNLLDVFDHNVTLSLAAYNAGLANVKRWVEEDIWAGGVENIPGIPFPETRSFVRRVLRMQRWYRILYRNFPA